MVASEEFLHLPVFEDQTSQVKLVLSSLQHLRHLRLVEVLHYECEYSFDGRSSVSDIANDTFESLEVGNDGHERKDEGIG